MKRFLLSPFVLPALLLIAGITGCGSGHKPDVSITPPASTTIDPGDSVTLTANVAHGGGEGVTWTLSGSCATPVAVPVSLCGTLTNETSTSATYTAPPTVGTALSVSVTATSVKDKSVAASVTLSIPANPAITTATGVLTAGQVGSSYTATIAVSGGISPYTWNVTSGNLPTGLNIGSSTGTISGTPTASGNYAFTLQVTDSGTPTALTASGQFSISIAAAPPIVFSTTSLANGVIGTAYSATIAATGGAGTLTYKVTTGSLPTGLSLSSAGAITGTPTATGKASFTVTASDAYGDSAPANLSITINYPQLTITTTSLPVGYVGTVYPSTTLAASGGSNTGYTWVWAAATGSSLPPGLSLSSAGAVTGTPTAAGAHSVVVTVTDSASNTASATLSLTVDPAVSVTTTSLPTGYVRSVYSSTTLAATGGAGSPYTWTWAGATGSSLPAGLNLSSAGVISGTPSTAGAYSVTVTAKDSAGNSGSTTLTILIDAGITIATTPAPPSGYQQSAYPAFNFSATGGAGAPYTWSWAAASGSATPPGLSLDPATGLIFGTPSAGGTYNVVVTATDSAKNTGQATFSIVIESSIAISTISPLPGATLNVAYSQKLTATGGSGTYTWSTTGTDTLSTVGLSFVAGVVAGTPNATGTATFTAVVTDTQSHTAQATFSVTVSNALTITTTSLPPGTVGSAYSQTLTAAGGTGTGYTWSATSSNLSTYGLSLSTTGVVSGTPTGTGIASFTANVKDSGNNTATQSLTITIYSTLSQNATNLSLTATTSVAYSGSIAGAGGSGNYCFTVTGLPSDGLSAAASNAGCGYDGSPYPIAGTPTTTGTVKFTVTMTDTLTNLSVSDSYNIVVSNPQPLTLPASNPSTLPSATVNSAYAGSITATGGVGPYTWKINGAAVSGTVALTDDLSASASGATLSLTGTPGSTGTVTLTNVTVTDSESTPVTAGPFTYTITVNPAALISGQISLNLLFTCGTIPSLPPVTVTLSDASGVVSTQTTDSNGNYSFTNLANGTYTVTPSISGAESLFFPASYTGITINYSSATAENFTADIGYTVSGNISYSGAKTGQTYVVIEPSGCPGVDSVPGTSIAEATLTSGGAFTVRGVPPGSWEVYAWMDTLGQGQPNTADPSGTSSAFSVTDADVTGAADTIADPTLTTPTASPTLKDIAPTDQGVVISFGGGSVSNGQGVEVFTSYTVQWSTSSTSFSGGSATFQAIGRTANIWIVNNAIKGITGSFTNGAAYYFRVRGANPVGNGPWSYWAGPKNNCSTSGCAITVTVGAAGASSGWNEITGTVTIPSSITVNSGAVLYAGYYDQNSNTAYATAIANPSTAAPNAYTVYVPSGSDYIQFGILDQNDDGLIDAGDVDNVNNGGQNQATVTISSPLTGQDFTLPSTNSNAVVTTSYIQNTYNNNGTPATESAYGLYFEVTEGDELPVGVTLASGPNVLHPLDMSSLCSGCGSLQYLYITNIVNTPKVGDSYTFDLTYAESSPATGTDTAAVTAVLGTAQAASALAPNPSSTSVSTTPTFTWTYPANPGNYLYQFQLRDQQGDTIWQIPSSDSNASGFTSTQIPMPAGLVYGTDPTDSTNTPTLSALAAGTEYIWQLTTTDSKGNQAVVQLYFITQ